MKMAKITVKLFTILASCVIIGCTTNTNSSSKECEEIIQKCRIWNKSLFALNTKGGDAISFAFLSFSLFGYILS